MGSPLARPFASVTRSGRTPSCSNAKNDPVRPTPVCTSSKQRSGESSAAAATNSRSSGTTPPSPRIGSRRIRPTSSSTAATSASTSFGGTKLTPGTSGANGSRFAGCPVTDSAPNVRPWNPPSSATTPGLPVALRAYLTAASIASAPELQKKACAPPKRSESAAASCSAGSVRYRFETCHNRSSCALRGRERSGMAVAERHDGDPAAEVEVLTPVGVPDAAAVAAHDREIGARVRRQEPLEPRSSRSSSRDHRRLADLGA